MCHRVVRRAPRRRFCSNAHQCQHGATTCRRSEARANISASASSCWRKAAMRIMGGWQVTRWRASIRSALHTEKWSHAARTWSLTSTYGKFVFFSKEIAGRCPRSELGRSGASVGWSTRATAMRPPHWLPPTKTTHQMAAGTTPAKTRTRVAFGPRRSAKRAPTAGSRWRHVTGHANEEVPGVGGGSCAGGRCLWSRAFWSCCLGFRSWVPPFQPGT